ncbi:MAG: hypothetical protein R6T98_05535 [Desulfatiglandales bacterium]
MTLSLAGSPMDTLLKRPTREPRPTPRRELKKCRPSLGKHKFCKTLNITPNFTVLPFPTTAS